MTSQENQIYREILDLVAASQRLFHQHQQSKQRCKAALFKAAKNIIELQRNHTNWFNEMLRSQGGADATYAKWFAPLETFGEDWRKLIADVYAGMTLKQYLASTAGSFTRRQKIAQVEAKAGLSISRGDPSPELSAAEQIEHWKRLATEFKAQLSEARRIMAQQETKIEDLEARINRIDKIVKPLSIAKHA